MARPPADPKTAATDEGTQRDSSGTSRGSWGSRLREGVLRARTPGSDGGGDPDPSGLREDPWGYKLLDSRERGCRKKKDQWGRQSRHILAEIGQTLITGRLGSKEVRGARGRTGRGPTLTHPRAESGPRTDGGGGGAHARRRGASAKNNGERREATAHLRAGRQRRRVSQPGDGKGRDARTARCANWRASSWSPRPQVRPAVCGGDRGRTCAMAPCSTPPPLAKPGQGTSRISQFLESWQLRGSPGVGE
ncbi:uncharacterized protein AAG666_004212 [Megaptera novaeangliae]